MATATCPRGHLSDDSEFCSVCGIAMAAPTSGDPASGVLATGGDPASASATVCPACKEPRVDMAARYCEVCRYDFVTGTSAAPATTPDPAMPSTPPPPPAPDPDPALGPAASVAPATPPTPVATGATSADPVTTTPTFVRRDAGAWEVVARVDPAQDIDPDPDRPCPVDAPDRIFALVGNDAWLVGRRDAPKGIFPDIPLEDNGASRRHMTLTWLADGTLGARDEGSANGTLLAGKELVAGVAEPVPVGAEIRIGRWTVLSVRRRP